MSMRIRLAILAASVAVNVLLATVIMRGTSSWRLGKVTESAHENGRLTLLSNEPSSQISRQSDPLCNPCPDPPPFQWSDLESDDYGDYIARLRAFGVPEKVVRDILVADISRLYRSRIAAILVNSSTRTNFWELRHQFTPWPGSTKEQRQQMRALQQEQKELIETLLGKAPLNSSEDLGASPAFMDRTFGPIPAELRDKVSDMRQRYQDATSEIYASSEGMIDQDTQADLKRLEHKFYDELAAILTPEQIKEYQMRNSDLANNLRWQFGAFDPTEAEYRAIFAYKQGLEDLNFARTPADGAPPLSAEESNALDQKEKELQQALDDTLGAERLKQYNLMDQGEYRNLMDGGVSMDTILQIEAMKSQVGDATRQVRQDSSLSQEERASELRDIRAETEKSLADLIGDRRARAFASSGGFWVRNISPKN